MNTKGRETRLPPYVSYKTWNTFLEKLKEQIPLPNRMDSSFWSRLPFSGSNLSALKGTLRYFSLIDSENRPNPKLEQLAQAEDQERQNLLRDILIRSYEDLLNQVDLSRATIGQLREYFKSVGADGQIGQKCTTYFLSLAKESGEKLHTSLQARVISTRGRRTGRKLRSKIIPKEQARVSQSPAELSESQIISLIDPSMIGLLQKLPRSGSLWEKEERDGWKKAFDALFEFLYPVKERE